MYDDFNRTEVVLNWIIALPIFHFSKSFNSVVYAWKPFSPVCKLWPMAVVGDILSKEID